MKALLTLTALFAATAACATPTPLDEIHRPVAFTVAHTMADVPALPLSNVAETGVCAINLDPLPEVLTLHLGDDPKTQLAFCVIE
ncbi:MAG: hypothetical protein AAFY97_10705 [Pseudomonadota bacterium]